MGPWAVRVAFPVIIRLGSQAAYLEQGFQVGLADPQAARAVDAPAHLV